MKLRNLAFSLITLGAATVAQAVTPAPVTYSPDDLLLGFRATGGTGATQDSVIDIGQASLYRDASGPFVVLGLGDIASDLVAVFGANWYTRSDLFWSITGTPGTLAVGADAAKTLYATREELIAGTESDPWKGGASGTQGTTTGKMVSFSQQFVTTLGGGANNSTSNSSVAIIQSTSDVNSYASFMPGGNNTDATTAFKFFNPTVEGAAGSVLDLYRIPVGYNIPAPSIGTFQLNSSGALTFTSKVPEPSSLGLLAAASAMLLARRRKAANA